MKVVGSQIVHTSSSSSIPGRRSRLCGKWVLPTRERGHTELKAQFIKLFRSEDLPEGVKEAILIDCDSRHWRWRNDDGSIEE